MKVHDAFDQGSGDWLNCRIGKVTASEASNLLTTSFEPRKGEMPKTYLFRKVAESFQGSPIVGFTSHSTEHGQMLEDEARKYFCFEHPEGDKMYNVGFCEHDNGKSGCSPDALIGENSGLELKAPGVLNHVRYLMEGRLPLDYIVQVHFSMYVTERPEWIFMSYCRKFPPLVLRVARNEEICEKIHAAVEAFSAELKASIEKLRNL